MKSRGGKSQRTEEKKKEDQRRERVRRRKFQVKVLGRRYTTLHYTALIAATATTTSHYIALRYATLLLLITFNYATLQPATLHYTPRNGTQLHYTRLYLHFTTIHVIYIAFLVHYILPRPCAVQR